MESVYLALGIVIALGAVLIWAFVAWQRRREAAGRDPLVHLSLLRIAPLRALAAVREAAHRCVGLRAFPVQLVGALALQRGWLAEMATGEGKTLVATLPAYLNALGGKGVQLVTVNDYLARRDANWMRPLYDGSR